MSDDNAVNSMVREISNELNEMINYLFRVQDGLDLYAQCMEMNFHGINKEESDEMLATGIYLNGRALMTIKYLNYRLSLITGGDFTSGKNYTEDEWHETQDYQEAVLELMSRNFGSLERLTESFNPELAKMFVDKLDGLQTVEDLGL